MAPRVDHALWDRLFARTAATGWPLQARLREMVAAGISEGWLVPGTPLPSSRELAEAIGVARNTVLLAYQQLVDEDLLESRERSGYFVRRRPEAAQPAGRPPASSMVTAPAWEHRFAIRPSAQRNIVKPHDWLAYPYPFVYGQFDPTLFPTNDWRECARQALSVLEIRGWAPDLIDGDDAQLVEQIRTRVLPRRGIWATADEIVITLGAQQALYMLAQLLVRPGMVVGVEDPGYPDARNILALRGAELRPVPVDEVGIVPDAIPPECELVFVTPTRQCPTGAVLPLERRQRLIELAEARDLLLLEDDYESNFGLSSDSLPTLRSLDRSGCVLYVGSLSKTLAPGLRFGYIVAAPAVVRETRALRRLILRHAPTNNQRALALFLALGHFDRLLRKVTTVFAERAVVMRDALERHLPTFTYSHGIGGSSFWVHGPEGLDSRALERRAAAAGILIEAGDVFFMSPTPPLHHFRLGFSSLPTERIEPGIAALARLAREQG
jgi:GntR family transcriptional regulator/MocR family aminotransferase